MLNLSRRRCAGGMLDILVPGYKDKIWAMHSDQVKRTLIKRNCDAVDAGIARHKWWGGVLTQWKAQEEKWKPSHKCRKPAVDWRRQEARGTLHAGKFYEGPSADGTLPSDYTPGNTFSRLDNVHAPFSDSEWAQRKQYRSWDMVKVLYGGLGLFFAYRLTGDWPTVWC